MMEGERTNGFKEVLFASNCHLRNLGEWYKMYPFGVFTICLCIFVSTKDSQFSCVGPDRPAYIDENR